MTTWTKKHHQFCLAHDIRNSFLDLFQYLVRRSNGLEPTELIFNLKDFWNWSGKYRGRKYDRKTLKSAIANLVERSDGLVVIQEQYSWYLYRLVIKPVHYWSEQKSCDREIDPNEKPQKPSKFNGCPQLGEKQQQQELNQVNEICSKVGLKYDRHALLKIWRLAGRKIEGIKRAIELMLYRHSSSSEGIPRPHGFLIQALKFNWQEGFNLYYQPELPRFQSMGELRQFATGLWATA